jgi:hypothetical protein
MEVLMALVIIGAAGFLTYLSKLQKFFAQAR